MFITAPTGTPLTSLAPPLAEGQGEQALEHVRPLTEHERLGRRR